MAFRAYNGGRSVISWKRDESGDKLGMLTTSQPPIGESETRDGITEIAYAFLGRDPTHCVYITDSQNRVLDKVCCDKYDKLRDDFATHAFRAQADARLEWLFMAWYLLFLCLACFLATLVFGLHGRGFGLFLVIAFVYIALVRLGIQNEVESAVACTIMLLLMLVVGPALKEAREREQQGPPAQHEHAPEPPAGPVSNGESSPPVGDADGSPPNQPQQTDAN